MFTNRLYAVSQASSSAQATPRLVVVGITFRDAAIELRERLNLSREQSIELLDKLALIDGVSEAVVLSTCNRVEVICAVSESEESCPEFHREVVQLFADHAELPRDWLQHTLFVRTDAQAVEHLFDVAAGLDSMVVGEPQIFGQLKSAYALARSRNRTGAILNRLFHKAFQSAKWVRTQTGISRNAVSVCFAARELVRAVFGDLNGRSLMLIGAGETGALALRHFAAAGVDKVFVVNRTLQRAVDLAERHGSVALDFDTYQRFLPQADIVIGAIDGAEIAGPLLSVESVVKARSARHGELQLYIDLGVPRNFDSEINSLEQVFLYSVDDLRSVVDQNKAFRRDEASRAHELLAEEVRKFVGWLELRDADRAIRDLRGRLDTLKRQEIEKSLKALRKLDLSTEEYRAVRRAMDSYAEALMAKMMHAPFTELKKQSRFQKNAVDFFRTLFSLD